MSTKMQDRLARAMQPYRWVGDKYVTGSGEIIGHVRLIDGEWHATGRYSHRGVYISREDAVAAVEDS